MDRIIDDVKKVGRGYSMNIGHVKILCYADDAVLISDNHEDLQRLLYTFHSTSQMYNMEISTSKTKSMVIAKEIVPCKLVIDDRSIEQVTNFQYLGVNISTNQNRYEEVGKQINKTLKIAGCMQNIIWNKHMTTKTKARIYKTCIRPIMTYAAETRADNSKTKSLLQTTEMKILRRITGNTLFDRRRNTDIRNECNTQDIVKWVRERRKNWNEHISRMSSGRIAKIVRDGRPQTKRPIGRPPKRWNESWISTSDDDT